MTFYVKIISASGKETYSIPSEDSAVAPMRKDRWELLFFPVAHRASGDIESLIHFSSVVSPIYSPSHVENGQVLPWTILPTFQNIQMLICLFLWEAWWLPTVS